VNKLPSVPKGTSIELSQFIHSKTDAIQPQKIVIYEIAEEMKGLLMGEMFVIFTFISIVLATVLRPEADAIRGDI